MYFDASIEPLDLRSAALAAEAAERVGFDGAWVAETKHDPFLMLGSAALTTSRISLGTAIAVAFPRSPTITAYSSWDLARASDGRFILGLGTQVKAHIERRFAVHWDAPAARLRDYIGAVRAVWRCWQTQEPLRYQGEFYTLKLMTPFFDPGPLPFPNPEPPIFIAGVNPILCRLAGEVCQGLHAHPFHTTRYLREAVLPAVEEGLAAGGRQRGDFQLTTAVFAIVGRGEERDRQREAVRRHVAFYASTPNYSAVLELHGWEAQGAQLSRLARRSRWDDMPTQVTDEMLAEIAVEGDTLADAARALHARYMGLLDRASLYLPFTAGEREEEWAEAVGEMRGT
ncbi:MAG: TIGR03617 family F420-dependent LLM class oxidoreductase [Chloroflexia bacterium]